jgi:hypothetical protein
MFCLIDSLTFCLPPIFTLSPYDLKEQTVKKVLMISNSVLLGVNLLLLCALLWFGNHTPTAYARAVHVSHQQNELDLLGAEVAAEHKN